MVQKRIVTLNIYFFFEVLHQLVVNHRKLNVVTEPYPYAMPRIEELLEEMGTAQIFSTLDLKK